jgi:processive 1,2-diacylglycerol beta-glucosyltransferase
VHTAARGAQLVVVAGRNRGLRDRLAGRALPGVRTIGFTEVMHDWMSLADLAITKPGGLTTAEATARGLPLVVAGAIPGQETRNATMLFEAGAAISGDNPLTIGHRVAELLRTPRRLASMRRAALRLARPGAALDIAEDVLALAR